MIYIKVLYLCKQNNKTDMMGSNIDKGEVMEAIRQTVWQLPSNVRAILFGSRARGDAKASSDWDVLLIVDKERLEKADYDNISYPLFELGWTLNEEINPILYTEKEWKNQSFTPFFHNVTKEGIAL